MVLIGKDTTDKNIRQQENQATILDVFDQSAVGAKKQFPGMVAWVAVVVLVAIVTGLVMMVGIDGPFWERNPFIISESSRGLIFVLHGKGKHRRHIKLSRIGDIDDKKLNYFIGQATAGV